tara:strand:- start:492 stop:809 length:318 start_codon:yes stop_codon:yes gene_type:complete
MATNDPEIIYETTPTESQINRLRADLETKTLEAVELAREVQRLTALTDAQARTLRGMQIEHNLDELDKVRISALETALEQAKTELENAEPTARILGTVRAALKGA